MVDEEWSHIQLDQGHVKKKKKTKTKAAAESKTEKKTTTAK